MNRRYEVREWHKPELGWGIFDKHGNCFLGMEVIRNKDIADAIGSLLNFEHELNNKRRK